MKQSLLALALAVTSATFGAEIVPDGPWQTVTIPTAITGNKLTGIVNGVGSSNAFWNQGGFDSPTQCANIGCYMTGSTFFAGRPAELVPAVSDFSYLGADDGTAISDFEFSGYNRLRATLTGEFAGFAPRNLIGWYDSTLTPDQLTASNQGSGWGVIYSGSNGDGDTALISTSTHFGLWFLPNLMNGEAPSTADLVSGFANDAKFTQSSKNTLAGSNGIQSFALMAQGAIRAQTIPADLWVGVEDFDDWDYNDMILHLELQHAPEAGYFSLIGLALVGLGWAQWRLLKSSGPAKPPATRQN